MVQNGWAQNGPKDVTYYTETVLSGPKAHAQRFSAHCIAWGAQTASVGGQEIQHYACHFPCWPTWAILGPIEAPLGLRVVSVLQISQLSDQSCLFSAQKKDQPQLVNFNKFTYRTVFVDWTPCPNGHTNPVPRHV